MKEMGDYCVISGSEVKEGSVIGSFVVVNKASIGRNCVIGEFTSISEGAVIGDDCFVGSHVAFVCTRIPGVRRNAETSFIEKNPEKSVARVMDGASIGAGCVVFPVTIGRNALIAAGSVVTRDVPDGEVWQGNPAKKVGYTAWIDGVDE